MFLLQRFNLFQTVAVAILQRGHRTLYLFQTAILYAATSLKRFKLGLSHWDPYAMHRGGYTSCIIVTWWRGPGGIKALSEKTNWLPSVL